MGDLPPDVQHYIDILSYYEENIELKSFNLIHMYPKEIAFPNGYSDSKYFELVAYNFRNHERKFLGHHDQIRFLQPLDIDIIRIYCDGSTMIRFETPVAIDVDYNAVEIMKYMEDRYANTEPRDG